MKCFELFNVVTHIYTVCVCLCVCIGMVLLFVNIIMVSKCKNMMDGLEILDILAQGQGKTTKSAHKCHLESDESIVKCFQVNFNVTFIYIM